MTPRLANTDFALNATDILRLERGAILIEITARQHSGRPLDEEYLIDPDHLEQHLGDHSGVIRCATLRQLSRPTRQHQPTFAIDPDVRGFPHRDAHMVADV